MKKKNLFMVLFVLATAMFYSCGSDDSSNNNGNNDDNPATDDNTPGVPHIMEGNWKTTEFTYEVPGTGQIVGPNAFYTWQECAADDYLTIKAAGVADLKENKKNNDNVCEDVVTNGTWTEQAVTISGVSREVISVDDSTLVLKYLTNMLGADILVTVEYSRQ